MESQHGSLALSDDLLVIRVDEQTLEDDTVTVRDRDSLAQERLPIAGVGSWLEDALERDWVSPKAS